MTKINIKFVIAVAAIVFASVVIALGILAVNKINGLNNQLEYLNSRISQLNNNEDYTQNQINGLKEEIQRQLNEQGRNYFDASYKIAGVNAQSNTSVVEVYFSLKESPAEGGVDISFGKGNSFDTVAATKLAGGKYTAQIELLTDKDYEISYSVTLTSIKTEKILEINVREKLKNRLNAFSSFYYSYETNGKTTTKDKVCLEFWLSNNHSNNEKLKIKTAVLEIRKDGILIKSINILENSIEDFSGYEQYANKEYNVVNELSYEDFDRSTIATKITVVDYFGLEYVF